MTESRHVASLVATFACQEEMDLIVQTLEESEFLRVEQVDQHYADIVLVDEGGAGE